MPWRVRDAVWTFVLALCAPVALLAAAQGLNALQNVPQADVMQAPAALTTAATSLFYLGMAAGVWWLIVHRYGVPWSALGLRAPRRMTSLSAPLLAALLVIGSVFILVVATVAIDAVGSPAYVVAVSGAPLGSPPLFIAAVILSLVLAPCVEELFFRGVLYQALRRRGGKVLAIAGSALLFTVIHARSSVAPELFLLGVILAMAFERTDSLYPSMGLHAAYNGAIFVLALHTV